MAKTPRSRPGSDTEDTIVTAIDRMTAEVRVLRQVIDELREEIQWSVRNTLVDSGPPLPIRRITSMPVDPTCDDFAERVNALTPADLPPKTSAAAAPSTPGDRAEEMTNAIGATGAIESANELAYCCDKPDLKWYGDPESPGIECANCQFPVAQEGDLVCWRGTDEPEGPPEDIQSSAQLQQRDLF